MEYSRYNGSGGSSRSSSDRMSTGNGLSSAPPSSGIGNRASSPTLSGLLTAVKQETVDALGTSLDDETFRLLMSAAAVTSSAAAYHQAHYASQLGGSSMNGFQPSVGRRSTATGGGYGSRSSRSSGHVMQAETCVCEVCQVEFGRLDALFRHKLLHFNTGRVCYVCDLYVEDGPDQLRMHVANQHRDIAGLHPKASDTAFVCPVCVQRFSTSKALIKHQGQMHCVDVSAGRRLTSGVSAGTQAGRQDLSCAICAVDFTCERGLIGHLNSPQHREMKVKLQSIFICIDCRSIFSSRDSYAFHMMTRAQNETCDVIAAAQNMSQNANHNNNNHNNNNGNGCVDDVISGQTNSSSGSPAALLLPPGSGSVNSNGEKDYSKSNGGGRTSSEQAVAAMTGPDGSSAPWMTTSQQHHQQSRLVPPLLVPTIQLPDELLVERLMMRGGRAAAAASLVGGGAITTAGTRVANGQTVSNNGFGMILDECSRRRNRQLETAVLLRILDETARYAQVGEVNTAAAAAAALQQLRDADGPTSTARRNNAGSKTDESVSGMTSSVDKNSLKIHNNNNIDKNNDSFADGDGTADRSTVTAAALMEHRPAGDACRRPRDISPLNLSFNSTSPRSSQPILSTAAHDAGGQHSPSSSSPPSHEQRTVDDLSTSGNRRGQHQTSDKGLTSPSTKMIPPSASTELDNCRRVTRTADAGHQSTDLHTANSATSGSGVFKEDCDGTGTSEDLGRRGKRCWSVHSDIVNRTSPVADVPVRSCRSADFATDLQPDMKRPKWIAFGGNGTWYADDNHDRTPGIIDSTRSSHGQDSDSAVHSHFAEQSGDHEAGGELWNGVSGSSSSSAAAVQGPGGPDDVNEFIRRMAAPHYGSALSPPSAEGGETTATVGHARTGMHLVQEVAGSWKSSRRVTDRRGLRLPRQPSAASSTELMELGGNCVQMPQLQQQHRDQFHPQHHHRHHGQNHHQLQQQQQQQQHQQQPTQNGIDSLMSPTVGARTPLNVCRHCDIVYADRMLFMLHMGLHNVNNPWQCNMCGTVCTDRQQFALHVLHY